MQVEIRILALAAMLLMVHIISAIQAKTKQYGKDWNTGARDEVMPPLDPVPARLERARDNFLETLPVAIIALAGVVLAGRTSTWTALGGWIWLGARVLYLPLYWKGVPKVRTLVYLVSLVGLALVLAPLLWP
ncbi:MAPEG family protein [Novosphingobium tardum]|uniref:MAPEG family protein n=1 Tax=Novosphingobium tardum TaxID=1538021 RepID=A0ABV8RLK7_9SPHN